MQCEQDAAEAEAVERDQKQEAEQKTNTSGQKSRESSRHATLAMKKDTK